MDKLDKKLVSDLALKYNESLHAGIASYKPGLKEQALKPFLDLCMADDDIRARMFWITEAFPALKGNNKEIVLHVREYLEPYKDRLPALLAKALGWSANPLSAHLAGPLIGKFINMLGSFYIIDSADKNEVAKKLSRLYKAGYSATVDILGEDSFTFGEAQGRLNQYLELIEWLPSISLPDVMRHDVSVKLSSIEPKMGFDPINFSECAERVAENFAKILRAGMKNNVGITVDMEWFAVRDLTLAIFQRALEEKEFDGIEHVGIAFQAYLADSEPCLKALLRWIAKRNIPVTIRLVKGAYWDFEYINAKDKNWPVPVFTKKEDTDRQYKLLAEKILLAQSAGVPAYLTVGSHNLKSLSYAMAVRDSLGLDKDKNKCSVLYGMGKKIAKALLDAGERVEFYAPYGEIVPGMAYLVRRLLENTSNESVWKQNFESQKKAVKKQKPEKKFVENVLGVVPRMLVPPGFKPEPLTDFALSDNRGKMKASLKGWEKDFGRIYPLFIDGKPVLAPDDFIDSKNPADFNAPSIGRVCRPDTVLASRAMEAAQNAFPNWSALPVKERADCLRRAASIMREQKFHLSALLVLEASKTWREADADVAEAIDFLEYYAGTAEHIIPYQVTEKLYGETNEYGYGGRGVAVVISPWNFVLAIPTGMSCAALVAGNSVVFKPASATALSGYKLAEIFHQAGVPAGVFNFVPGSGRELGEFLVKHPYTTNVLFTGSNKVARQLQRWALDANEEQDTNREVRAETGGKNAIIVDSSADLDQAIPGVIKSAFGYQGQKCSACSRVIVLENINIYDEFVSRLIEATKVLKIGDPVHAGTDMGAVIDKGALDNDDEKSPGILQYIEIGKQEAKLAYQKDVGKLAVRGYFIGPTIFTDVAPNAVIAQEEIFGPVLAVIRVKSFDEAIVVANSTRYNLTGGVYSRTVSRLQEARKYFRVGNLYLNRHITGAVVGRQPFGAVGRASGTGPKLGGPDYLFGLMEPKTISECITRRGFSPEIEIE